MSSTNRPRPPSPTSPDLSIFGDNLTVHPSGYTQSPTVPTGINHNTNDRNLVENMTRFREAPLDFLREVRLYVAGEGWRSYDNIVGQPVFYQGFTERMIRNVMGNPMVAAKIVELAGKRVDVEAAQGLLRDLESRERRRREIETSLREVAEQVVDDMVCKMENKKFIRGAYYLATQLLTRAYHQGKPGIHVSSEEVLRLRAVAEKAKKNKQSIIFLPCHRSHVDYISLQLICYRLGLTLPVVVAGDNLNFPLVGPFLQHAGAMWIRRSFGDDGLYVTLVQAYIDTMLRGGFNFECFIEGGRSRTGKLLPPKFGILSFLLDSVLSGRVNDAIVCPVSTQYDKVIEVDSYINELLGRPKPKENLMNFFSASSVLSLKLGRIDVRFHEPWGLRDFIDQQTQRFSRMPNQDIQKSHDATLKIRLLRTLGYKVLSDINSVSVVMPTALIGTILLTLRGRGVGKSELIRRVEWLSERVRAQGGRVAHFAGLPTSTVVERGLEVLGSNLVGVVEDVVEETYYAVDRFQLSFYRNMTIHLFISQSLVSAALYSRVKVGGNPASQSISYDDLMDYVSFLSQLFRGEFIFPTEGLAVNLTQTINDLETDNVLNVTRCAPSHEVEGIGQGETREVIRKVELSDEERASGRENFDFYCFMIWPFIEASWLGAVSLLMLAPPALPTAAAKTEDFIKSMPQQSWLPMPSVQSYAQLLGKTFHAQGDLSYFEAVNKETLKNAYDRFEEEGIIIVSKPPKETKVSSVPKVRLSDDWMPHRDATTGQIVGSGRLWDFCEMISISRREGKNRRDGATVRTRVLSLVEMVGNRLWGEEAVAAGNAEELAVTETGKTMRRAARKRSKLRTRSMI